MTVKGTDATMVAGSHYLDEGEGVQTVYAVKVGDRWWITQRTPGLGTR